MNTGMFRYVLPEENPELYEALLPSDWREHCDINPIPNPVISASVPIDWKEFSFAVPVHVRLLEEIPSPS